jgi:hypothetical protein
VACITDLTRIAVLVDQALDAIEQCVTDGRFRRAVLVVRRVGAYVVDRVAAIIGARHAIVAVGVHKALDALIIVFVADQVRQTRIARRHTVSHNVVAILDAVTEHPVLDTVVWIGADVVDRVADIIGARQSVVTVRGVNALDTPQLFVADFLRQTRIARGDASVESWIALLHAVAERSVLYAIVGADAFAGEIITEIIRARDTVTAILGSNRIKVACAVNAGIDGAKITIVAVFVVLAGRASGGTIAAR